MADNKKGFILYADLIHTVSELPREIKGDLFQLILDYVNDKNPDPTDILLKIAFSPIKLQLKRDLNIWESKIKQRSEAGKRSAVSRSAKSTTVESRSTNQTVIVNDIVNVTDTVNVNVKVKDNVKVIFNFKNELLKYGFSENLVNDWLIVRKNKKASNTETAFKGFISEIERRPCNLNETLSECVKNSWSGFKWEWLDNLKHNGKTGNKNSNEAGLGDLADKARNILRNFDTENG